MFHLSAEILLLEKLWFYLLWGAFHIDGGVLGVLSVEDQVDKGQSVIVYCLLSMIQFF